MDKLLDEKERRGSFWIIPYIEKPIGLVKFWEEIAFFTKDK